MFRRLFGSELSLNRVHDRLMIKEGNETLDLRVDSDPRVMVTRIRQANELLMGANKEKATDEDRINAAKIFSEAVFGKDQALKLAELYNEDYSCVMAICGMYFEKRLCKKITKAQKKIK